MNVPNSWAFGKGVWYFLLAFGFQMLHQEEIYLQQVEENPQCLRHFKTPLTFWITVLYSKILMMKKKLIRMNFSVLLLKCLNAKAKIWVHRHWKFILRKYKYGNMTKVLYHNRTSLGNQFSEKWTKFRAACNWKQNRQVKHHSWAFLNFHR